MKRGIKTCIECKHFNFSSGDYGYSEMTPGWDAIIECSKRHWTVDLFGTYESDYRKYMRSAQDCKDFEQYAL
jgi:hypothetical protein